MKNYLKTLSVYITLSYTMVSICGAVVNIITGTTTGNANVLIMFGICVIASFVLSLNRLFDRLSLLAMIIIQYIVVIALCAGFMFILSLFDPISLKGWLEYFRSFTIPYIIIAAIYYWSIFHETKKQNKLISEIQETHSL